MVLFRFGVVLAFLIVSQALIAQKTIPLIDGSEDSECVPCKAMIDKKPKEVLFGIYTKSNGDVYFTMDNIEWFHKLFANDEIGVSADFVVEDRYNCNQPPEKKNTIYKGIIIPPVYKKRLLANNESGNGINSKIGTLPASLKDKTFEENLIIVSRNKICYYTHFVNMVRSDWDLLPMGLFADTLIKSNAFEHDPKEDFTYSKKIEIVIPFKKGTSAYSISELKSASDSLNLKKFTIQKIEIRSYSSIEGPENINIDLMKKRGDAMIAFLRPYQSNINRSSVLAAENWLEFFASIKGTEFDYLKNLSKSEIKKQLTNSALAKKLEPLLANERKSVAVLYLLPKTIQRTFTTDEFLLSFKKALASKKISEARSIQLEAIEQIRQEKLPLEYLDKMEVPKSKEFISLANDRVVYLLLYDLVDKEESLVRFLEMRALDRKNAKVNYNICALKLELGIWDKEILKGKELIDEIDALLKMGIDKSLVQRMEINHHILKSREYLNNFQYDEKDSVMEEIRDLYDLIEPTDEEIYSLAKFYSYHYQTGWAFDIIKPRIQAINVDENLLFYYINLLFYHPSIYGSESFTAAILNAVNLNRLRYCSFYQPHDFGGASMQLLEHDELRKYWCQSCR
ncbi:MAG: hypothetical protein HOP30_18400 [Cyclobacteriaceae bacterium]|nr:hypothetical protein [Cyclobacteriaceae bacterium]